MGRFFALIAAVAGGVAAPPANQQSALAAAMDIMAKSNTPPPPPREHTVLKVGLKEFEVSVIAGIEKELESKIPKSASPEVVAGWRNATEAMVKKEYENATAPIKHLVAESWMKLKDDKRDQFAEMISAKYAEIYNKSLPQFVRRVGVPAQFERTFSSMEHFNSSLAHSIASPTTTLVKQMKDYTDLIYYGNIFLQSRKALSLIAVILPDVE
mmetsp:Transcript_15097/g.33288  ORF Transcript_15097/g.33288 Transcript_15097/m.33288 type:complete len:212 (+) Transcript_15097:98-733(+)|eukprot:CAMPEP_0204271436 /NCGR_PEP_ID=MMETSP0468-20130131/19878_1 /ASSEMBLY_ACC=CAM_ASM_000383 /TAXON_ID=2969 /ORGANISM="Oxyrrhis marina" /LENGTH=211 /DNA_ID=CAMNT_0051247107 /DNA_START=75 /DNA_END=710 /DNA_ORIENTATION=-